MSARRDLEVRINDAACSIDGISAIVEDMVESSDLNVSRSAYACADFLKRLSADLSGLAVEVREATQPPGDSAS